MKNHRTRKLSQRVRYALLAGMAGTFLIPQAAFAGPTGEHGVASNINIQRPDAVTTTITSTALNNVINWQDYSVKQGELVQYDGGAKTNNYLNIVTGANTSNINGKIEGGNNVYIVNPNGVIFGKSAEVNVGNLYVSTQDTGTLNRAAFEASGTSPLDTTAALKADVVNMGKINATSVEVHGSHIRFLNAADVTATNPVVLHTETAANGGYAHIGYKNGTIPAAAAYQVNGLAAVAADNYYQLVKDKTELDAINTDTASLAGNYMLEQDIDLGGEVRTPIGSSTDPFKGKVEGNFFQVRNFTVTSAARAGFFDTLEGASIYNFGIAKANIQGTPSALAGGLAVESKGGTTLKNVYVSDSTVTGRAQRHGGLIGITRDTQIEGSYSKVKIDGAGIAGRTESGTVIRDTYTEASPINGTRTYFIHIIQPAQGTTITNSYAKTTDFVSNDTALTYGAPGAPGTTIYGTYLITGDQAKEVKNPAATAHSAATVGAYSAWGNDINNTGEFGAKWRIYEGRTLPMLTAFMSGTATATYNYRYFKSDQSAADTSAAAIQSNHGADVAGLTYNSHYVKIVGTPNTSAGDKSNVVYSGIVDENKVHDYVGMTKDFDRANGVRNAGTKAILWSDQDGPNLRGVNVTIGQREVQLTGGNLDVQRMYNGKKSVKDAFVHALKHGGVSSSGFMEDDINAHSVMLDTTNFTAEMADKNVVRNADGTTYGKKDVTFGGTITFSGADAGNYHFDTSSINTLTGKAMITPAPLYLTIAKSKAADKIYDGTDVVADDDMKQSTGTKNIQLNDTITDGTSDGTLMTDDNGALDTVTLKNIADPTYTDTSGTAQVHVGSHKLRYTNVGLDRAARPDSVNYDLYYTPDGGTKTAVADEKIYLNGDITRRQIARDSFTVYKSDNTEASATKVYDGTDTYTPGAGLYLSSNEGASTDPDTGIVTRDQGHITFQLAGGAHFTDSSGNRTSDVRPSAKVAYTAKGQADDHTDTYGGHLLSDYYVLDTDGVTKKNLENTFSASGVGKIMPKALTATVVNNQITKAYDAMEAQTDGRRNIIKGDALVALSGFVGSDTRTNTSTAKYATKNVVLNGNSPTTQAVTYTASFDPGTGANSDNYTLGTEGALPARSSSTLTGTYTGIITPRAVTVKFADVTKIYDGTSSNLEITANDLDDGLNKEVLNADHLGIANLNTASVTSRYGDTKVGNFAENWNAGDRSVEYAGLSNSLGTNYTLANKQYGNGKIMRRRIDPSGINVYKKSDNTLAAAEKVYDGISAYTPGNEIYLSANAPALGDTGIVARDQNKVTFALVPNTTAHFTEDAAGVNRTSHVAAGHYVAYDIVAQTTDEEHNPLSNYTFGAAGHERDLERVDTNNPAHVTAAGRITPAQIQAVTKEITKVYDGMAEHTDGNRNIQRGSGIVDLALINDVSGQPVNTSTASYADKNVARDMSGNIIKKSVNYTAQLTGKYADDYQIVDAGNHVISTASGSGDNKTVTAALGSVADAGTITPRRLNITMGETSKRYDRNAANNSASVAQITGAQGDIAVNNTILGADGVTAGDLQAEYRTQLTGDPTLSSYGRGTGAAFAENVNASNGTKHDVRYKKMKTAFDNKFSAVKDNYEVDETVYGKGTITRKEINGATFKVSGGKATKAYDGTSKYTVAPGRTLEADTGEIIAGDVITFAIDHTKGAKFTQNDGVTETKNVADARKVAYHVTAAGNAETLRNYTLNGKNLEAGDLAASGDGEITRRVLSLDLVQKTGIDKEYDREKTLRDTDTKHWNKLTDNDSLGNVKYADGSTAENKLVSGDGTSFEITSNYMDNAPLPAANWDVRRDGFGQVISKDILYRIRLNGDPSNYSFKKGMTVIDAETELELSATGKITPKDLSGAFKRVEKVYDGTTSVPSGAVGFDIGTPGGVVSGDVVTVKAGYGAVFESPNVKGSGTSRVIGGAAQHNWVNYTNVELDGAQAGNYKITPDANGRLYGLGEITPFKLDSNTVINFGTVAQATKIYDGKYGVKRNESAAPDTVKGYIEKAEVQVGTQTLNLYDRMSVTSATYDEKKVVNNGISQHVTYNLTYTPTDDGNIVLAPNAVLKATGTGIITKRDVNVTVKNPLTKQYDAGLAVKDASGNVITGSALNNLVELTNLTGNDGATYTTTAVYMNENVGTNKQVKYEVTLDAASAGNYNLKHNGGNGNAFKTFDNVIEKRKVKVNFKDVSKTYDTTTANPDITGFVSDADAEVLNTNHAGVAQADPANNNKYKLQNLGALTSNYGAGDTDATFNANADAGANKDVQYAGLGAAMNNTLGGAASNYEFDVNGYGKGVIGKKTLNDGDVDFNFDPLKPVTKIYDGGRKVKYLESDKPADVKNYFTNAMWNGHNILDSLEVDTAEYDNKNVNGGAVHNITYKFKLSAANKNFELGTNLTKAGTGKITPKDLSGSFRKITKVYDGTTDVDPGAVGFEFGAVAAGDDLTLATHTESFQSPEIDGDGTTAVINGTPQKNWINYTNLTLNGADAGNYTLASAAKGLGEIRSPRPAYYTPDAEYYKELTQTSRMIPNEYAYENASMDQSGHFGRGAEAEVAYRTPSVNMTMDGMDLSKPDILVTDRAVFAIVSEVFG
ncbi:MAG: YDG domain-containing protein [Selenomonas noxia]